MKPLQEIEDLFFKDLKQYNSTNFNTLRKADLSHDDASVHKAFSSVVTRYFIFREKHSSELTEAEFNLLFFKLKIDLIGKYFSEYPGANTDSLVAFQSELNDFVDRIKRGQVTDEQTKISN